MPVTFKLKSTARTLMAASALSLLMAGSAFAFDGNAVALRLKELQAEQGSDLSYKQVETSGSTVILKGTTVKLPGTPAAEKPFNVGDITLSDVSDAPDGGYDIGKADVPDMSFPFNGLILSGKGMELENIHLAAKGSTDPLASIVYYQKSKVDEMTIAQDGKDIATLHDLETTVSPYKEGSPIDYAMDIDKVAVDLSKAKPSEFTKMLGALGYKEITGNLVSKSSWSPSGGNMKLDQFDLTMDQGGKLGMTFDAGGFTLDFLKEMQEAQKTLAASQDKDAKDATSLAMVGLFQQLTINGASIRFDDASLTGKVLDYYAKKQGTDRSTIVNQTKAVLPFLAGQLKNAAFATQVTQAVGTYLDNPKSLEIRATPTSPTPIAVLMATGAAQPERLPDVLGVTVTADK